MRVNWLLVWGGLFVLHYPITEFMMRIMRPSASFLPAWLFAACQAFAWTCLHWSARNSPQQGAPESPHVRPELVKQRLWIAIAVAAIGVISQAWAPRLTWMEIPYYAVLIPLSMRVTEYLVGRSGLGRVREGEVR